MKKARFTSPPTIKTNSLNLLAFALLLTYCTGCAKPDAQLKLNGTWQLVQGTEVVKGVKTITDYTKNERMIKIINDTHFSFLKHHLAWDTTGSNGFDAGGGPYTLVGNKYTEHLDYYSKKNIQGNAFTFTVTIKNDTLVQQGLEKLKDGSATKVIYETYVRVDK